MDRLMLEKSLSHRPPNNGLDIKKKSIDVNNFLPFIFLFTLLKIVVTHYYCVHFSTYSQSFDCVARSECGIR